VVRVTTNWKPGRDRPGDIPTAREIVERIVTEAEHLIHSRAAAFNAPSGQ
jgi:hypothetical protein